jgi:O-antigen ligase
MASVSLAVDRETIHWMDTPEGLGVPLQDRGLIVARVTLVSILTLSTLAFGGVQAWAWGLLSIVTSALVTLWASAAIRRGSVTLVWTPLYVPALMFLLVASLQFTTRFTADRIATRESLLKLITDLLIFFLACELWHDATPRALRRLGLALTAFAGGLALFGILQFFANPGMIYGLVRPRWGGWIFGPYVNHNHYAGLMEMLVPLALGYVMSGRGQRPNHPRSFLVRGLGPLAILIVLASVLLSGSRGGMISLTFEAVLLGAIAARCLPLHRRRRLALASLLAVVASTGLFLCLDPGRISQRLGAVTSLSQAPEATLGEREALARDALRIFRAHPWLGTGFGSFATVYPRYRSFPSDLEWDHAHDDYAEALAETAVAGGGTMALAIGLFVALAFGNLRERLSRDDGWIQLGAAVGCCGLLVHSFGDFNLHIPANAAWFAFLAGIAVSGAPRPISSQNR